jgi:signal peptidase I
MGCWSVGSLVALAICLRCFGLLIPYRLPTAGMHPTLRNGDQFFMEGVTYLMRAPARGDLVVFRTRGIAALRTDEIYVKRLVGLPGDEVRIADGVLYVNSTATTYRAPNHETIRFTNAGMLSTATSRTKVPADAYFVLGDNSANSADSRYWGAVPAKNIKGRIWFRYWPWR